MTMIPTTVARAQSSPSPLGIVLSLSTPRLFDGRPRQAGLLARGLKSLHHLPGSFDPVVFEVGRTAYSCGGSPGFEPEFPLIPVRGTYRVSLRCNNLARRSTASG